MEKFIYIHDGTAVHLFPAKNFRGGSPASDTVLEICFTPIQEDGRAAGKDNDIVEITTSSNNKHKEVLVSITNELALGENPLVVIFDSATSEKINSNIASVAVTKSTEP
jgi:hypothetical protein